MLHKILEPDRIEDKCNILLKILLLSILPTLMVFISQQTRHPSDLK